MKEIKNPSIKLKQKLNKDDYIDINTLKKQCIEWDQTTLKLELEYKLNSNEKKSIVLDTVNEFMYYDEHRLIGYVGIFDFGGDEIEVNGMVHPEYRRKGIFSRLFLLVKDEWQKRKAESMLLLSDIHSVSGLEFIKSTGACYDHSEYEMFLRGDSKQELACSHMIVRKATNKDAKQIAIQDAIYFDIEYNEENISMPEEEEKCGRYSFIAEVDSTIIGKVRLEIIEGIGGIYGLGVLPEYRKKGYGRELLYKAIEKLKEKNVDEIMLQVVVKNKNALNLYKSCGFVETSTMEYYGMSKDRTVDSSTC
jgi:ribosomal protein S18 acetylase RimI-like enzyme